MGEGEDTGEKKEEQSNGADRKDERSIGDEGKVSMLKMFKFADSYDMMLMAAGTAAALANGISQPMMTLIFGQMIDAFGGATSVNVLHRVNSV